MKIDFKIDYKKILIRNDCITNHFYFCDAIKKSLHEKLKTEYKSEFKWRKYKTPVSKIHFMRGIKKVLGIKEFEIHNVDDPMKILKNDDFKKIKGVANKKDFLGKLEMLFDMVPKTITTVQDLKCQLVAIYKQLFGKYIVGSNTTTGEKKAKLDKNGKIMRNKNNKILYERKNRIAVHKINDKLVKLHLELYKRRDNYLTTVLDSICEKYELEQKERTITEKELLDMITDDDEIDVNDKRPINITINQTIINI